MPGAIDMGSKYAPVFGYFARTAQRIHLIAAAVCQDCPAPPAELVEASGLSQNRHSRPKIQVVGVAKDYLGANVIPQFALMYCFHSTGSAHRHKDRGMDITVGRVKNAS